MLGSNTRKITAFNTAAASENRIHDDDTARRFGFTGALVPGVEVYAYLCHMPVARWGRAFLERGGAEARFFKPVYDGADTTIRADEADDGRLTLTADCAGARSAEGWAVPNHGEAPPDLADLPEALPPAERPPAGFDTLPPGRMLGLEPVTIDEDALMTYLREISDDETLYVRERLVHPGQILRLCNAVLVQNVVLGPWIHVGSRARHFAAARLGDRLTLRARVLRNEERKGHCIVTLDALAVADGATPVARIEHVAIWRPRQAAPA